MTKTPAAEPRPWLTRGPSRVLSLLLAVPLALLLLIHPAAFLDGEGRYSHSLLMAVMFGVSIGFVHGVGFDPRSRVWRLILHPLTGWVLMGLGYLLLGRALAG